MDSHIAHQAQGFINVPANGHIVDCDLLKDPFRVDNEQAPQSKPSLFYKHAIPCSNVLQSTCATVVQPVLQS